MLTGILITLLTGTFYYNLPRILLSPPRWAIRMARYTNRINLPKSFIGLQMRRQQGSPSRSLQMSCYAALCYRTIRDSSLMNPRHWPVLRVARRNVGNEEGNIHDTLRPKEKTA